MEKTAGDHTAVGQPGSTDEVPVR